jgi:hypothetical protein
MNRSPQIDQYMNFSHPMTTYSCRFECPQDVTQFILLAYTNGVKVFVHKLNQAGVLDVSELLLKYLLPDTHVEFNSPADLETLRNVLRMGVDLHVGLQTLRPLMLSRNTLERDYDLI